MKVTGKLPYLFQAVLRFVLVMLFIGAPSLQAQGFIAMGKPAADIPQEFAGGSGSEEDPYQVAEAGHLYKVRDHLDKHFIQTADIDLSGFSEGEGWEPIGTWNFHDGHEEKILFEGIYDGGGYTISNLTINRKDQDSIGLFGAIDEEAELRNISIKGAEVAGNRRVGALLGKSFGGNLYNCSAEGRVTGLEKVGILAGRSFGNLEDCFAEGSADGENRYVGGLIGLSAPIGNISRSYAHAAVSGYSSVGGLAGRFAGNLRSSYADGTVEGVRHVGGLIGWSSDGSISSSYSTGEVRGTGRNIGGLIGWSAGNVTRCYSTSQVSGEQRVGGLIGYVYWGEIHETYAAGKVSGNKETGGLVGAIEDAGSVERSYFDKETTGMQQTADAAGRPQSTEEMMDEATFENWNFRWTWVIDPGESYPYFTWEDR